MNVLKEENQAEIEKIEANINRLKEEHANEVAKAQANIDAMRGNVSSNKDDIEAKITELDNADATAEQSKIDLKASAKAKLIAGEPLTEEEANTIVL